MSKTDFASKDLKDRVADLEELKHTTLSTSHTINANTCDAYKIGRVVNIIFNLSLTSNVSSYNSTILTIPNGYRPIKDEFFAAVDSNGKAFMCQLQISGNVKAAGVSIPSGTGIASGFTYICNN